jgi:hypothetical protein
MRKTQLKIHLDNDLRAWVGKVAKRRRCSASQVIRDLIVEAMVHDNAR